MSEIIGTLKEKLQLFGAFLKAVKGTEDAKLRPNMILDPDNPLTSSKLSESQVEFVANAYSITDYFPEFEPLKNYAHKILLASESQGGWGVEKIIEYEQALGEKRMMQLGLGQQPSTSNKLRDSLKTNRTKE